MFLMRGKQEKQDLAKANIMEIASKHSSDLELLWETFLKWYDSGVCSGALCERCKKPIPKKDNKNKIDYSGCRFCRLEFAQLNKLNKRVLERALSVKENAIKLLQNIKFQGEINNSITFTEKIGRCLIASFKEHIGELLFPENPSIGVHLLDGSSKGSFSSTSVFLQKSQKNITTVIAMSIVGLPGGYFLLDQVHPILHEWIPEKIKKQMGLIQKDIQECFSFPNCHGKYKLIFS